MKKKGSHIVFKANMPVKMSGIICLSGNKEWERGRGREVHTFRRMLPFGDDKRTATQHFEPILLFNFEHIAHMLIQKQNWKAELINSFTQGLCLSSNTSNCMATTYYYNNNNNNNNIKVKKKLNKNSIFTMQYTHIN